MDEDEYRATYHELNRRRCVFEKAINSRVCDCSKSRRFNLADREGVACQSPLGQSQCMELIGKLRVNARFAFRLAHIDGPLAHSSEMKIQNGGLLGVQKVLSQQGQSQSRITDINRLVCTVIDRLTDFDGLPYDEIMQSVVNYQARRRFSRHKK